MSTDFTHRPALRADAAFDLLEADIVAEKAASLGHHGRQVEAALAALGAFDPAGDPALRLALVKRAARAVWGFLVQRELCGLRDQQQIIAEYRIPGEVLARLGAMD
jgi:hypothetical protein